jgi:hypothetical protein
MFRRRGNIHGSAGPNENRLRDQGHLRCAKLAIQLGQNIWLTELAW